MTENIPDDYEAVLKGAFDYYKLLGVSHGATSEDIIRAWRRKIHQYHPDRAGETGLTMAQVLNHVKTVLTDPRERVKYDEKLSEKNEGSEECSQSFADLICISSGTRLSEELRNLLERTQQSFNKRSVMVDAFRSQFQRELVERLNALRSAVGYTGTPRPNVGVVETFLDKVVERPVVLAANELLFKADKVHRLLTSTLHRSVTQTRTEPIVCHLGQKYCPYNISVLSEEEVDQLFQWMGLNTAGTTVCDRRNYLQKHCLPKCETIHSQLAFWFNSWRQRCNQCGASGTPIQTMRNVLVEGAGDTLRIFCFTCSAIHEQSLQDAWKQFSEETDQPQLALLASAIASEGKSVVHKLNLRNMESVRNLIEKTEQASLALYVCTRALEVTVVDTDIKWLKRRQCMLLQRCVADAGSDDARRTILLWIQKLCRTLGMEMEDERAISYMKKFTASAEATIHQVLSSNDFLSAIDIVKDHSSKANFLLHVAFYSGLLLKRSLTENYPHSKEIGYLLRGAAKMRFSNCVAKSFGDLFLCIFSESHFGHFMEAIQQTVCQMLSQCASQRNILPCHSLFELLTDPFSDCHGALPPTSKLKPSSEQVFPGFFIEGHDIKVLRRCEKAICSGRLSHLEAAFSSFDLCMATSSAVEAVECMVQSAAWMLVALCHETEMAKKFAMKTVLFTICNQAMGVCLNSSVHMSLLARTALRSFAILRQAAGACGNAADVETLLNTLEIALIAGRFSPFLLYPQAPISEALILSSVVRRLQDMFCEAARKEEDGAVFHPLPLASLSYEAYESAIMSGHTDDEDDMKAMAEAAIEDMMAEQGVSPSQVVQLINPVYLETPTDGWLVPKLPLNFKGLGNTFSNIQQVAINKSNGEISVTGTRGNLVSELDVLCGALLDSGGVAFSLNHPTKVFRERYHPYQECWTTDMPNLIGTPIFDTLLNTDYLMKQFSCGYEINRFPPFEKRPISPNQGLFRGLSPGLQHSLRSLKSRGERSCHWPELWISTKKMTSDVEHTSTHVIFHFGDVEMEVKTSKMMNTSTDKQENTSPNSEESPDESFAKDMTQSYDVLSEYFPEFQRLKELAKLTMVSSFVKSFAESLADETPLPNAKINALHEEMRVESQKKIKLTLSNIQQDVSEVRSKAKELRRGGGNVRAVAIAEDGAFDRLASQLAGTCNVGSHIVKDKLVRGQFSWIGNRLASANPVPSNAQIQQAILQHKRQNSKTFNAGIEALKGMLKRTLQARRQSIGKCTWIPSVMSAEADPNRISVSYGGVSLMATVLDHRRPQPSWYNLFMRTSTITPQSKLSLPQFPLRYVAERPFSYDASVETGDDDSGGYLESIEDCPWMRDDEQGRWSYVFCPNNLGHVLPHSSEEAQKWKEVWFDIIHDHFNNMPDVVDETVSRVNAIGRANGKLHFSRRVNSGPTTIRSDWVQCKQLDDGQFYITSAGSTLIGEQLDPNCKPTPFDGEEDNVTFIQHGKKSR